MTFDERCDAREQHRGTIGFGHEVVSTQAEGHDLGEFVVLCREDDDGDIALPAHVATDGLPIRSGKAKVQDDAIGIDVDDVMCGGFEVIAGACLVSVELEQVRELVAQGRVIFDDVDDGHDGIPFAWIWWLHFSRTWA